MVLACLGPALLWGEVLVYPGLGLCYKIELSNFVHSYIISSFYLIVCVVVIFYLCEFLRVCNMTVHDCNKIMDYS